MGRPNGVAVPRRCGSLPLSAWPLGPGAFGSGRESIPGWYTRMRWCCIKSWLVAKAGMCARMCRRRRRNVGCCVRAARMCPAADRQGHTDITCFGWVATRQQVRD